MEFHRFAFLLSSPSFPSVASFPYPSIAVPAACLPWARRLHNPISPPPPPFLPLLLIFSVCPPASAGAEEGEALLRFKATLSGPGADLPSWIPGPAPCNVNDTTWDGVICFNSHIWGLARGQGLASRLDIGR
ncbi:hypothetical protein HPP92_000428 [Vanilla planifolia]|uniref:Leucine-rich repeat-containing N-terminal plant-type domain-containing protein n=1 Tax=Vanilla planifolia TaxID=51239 RepID=A0A835S5N2_VANPL|nr:hypothetical protein HPP92_000428 [Vanilla planifolia]